LKLERGFKRNVAKEKRASGISPEHTKLNDALEEIIDKSKAAEEEWGKRMMMNESMIAAEGSLIQREKHLRK